MPDKIPYINLLQGTRSDHDFSTGNTLPLVARPWGLHHWTFQTGASPWTFDSRKKKLWGIRLTHQPSPWMRDYASLMLAPFHGDYFEDPAHQASSYRVEEAVLQPAFLKTEMLRYGITVELAPSLRGAILVFTAKASQPLKLRFDFDGNHELAWNIGSRVLQGKTADHFEGEDLKNFGLHFQGQFSETPESFHPTAKGGYLIFPAVVRRVELRVTGSFISGEMALLELERELAGKSLLALQEEGAREWNELLNRIDIRSDSKEQLRTFYSCLYRCLLFPRFLDERDDRGQVVHYSPHDGNVHEGSLCADSGFWDTYRTLYPLLALVYPDVLSRMMDGWMNVCRESGWTPKWASPGARDCMIGTHFDVLVADMVAKGLTDWKVEEAFAYLWKDATEPGSCGKFGRRGLQDYIQYGYVPQGKGPYSISSTLDYAYDDFCVGQVAAYLGKPREAELLRQRSLNYRNLFDSSTGFMRARSESGDWTEAFREFAWGGDCIEGGPWQHRFNVPHDVEGLISAMGGKEPFCRQLDAMLEGSPTFEVGSYPFEIHEMTEMAVAGFGQYAHSNQPVHNYLFLYALAGEPEKTDYWVGKVLRELYTPDLFPGDEDNGEMSAWYVWAMLGLYPVCPGRAEYVSFTPALPSVEIHLPGRENPLRIHSKSGGIPKGLISHQELISGVSSPMSF